MSLKSQEFLAWEGRDGEGLFYKDWSCPFSSGLVHNLLCTGGSAEAVEGDGDVSCRR